MKLKDYIKKALEIPKGLFKRFPCSISLSILLSFVIALTCDKDIFEDIIGFVIIFPMGILFSEVCFNNKKNIKYISFILSIIMAVFFNRYLTEQNELITRYAVVYSIILITIGLIKLLKDSKLSLNEYGIRLLCNSFIVHIVSGIISTGILLIAGIIILLFKAPEMLIIRLEIIFGGVFIVPAIIYALSDTSKPVWSFIKFIVKNILSVILFMAFIIVYIYMLKILITWRVPSNYIFRILSILFALGLPIWTMIGSLDKNNLIVKANNKLPLAFIPLFILQVYSLILRISSYGITISRYIGICFLIFEVVYLIIYFTKQEKIYFVGYVIIILSIIGIAIPKINAIDITVTNQFNRINALLNKTKLTQKERESLYSTYVYLIGISEGERLINEQLTQKQIDYIEQNDESEERDYKCYNLSAESDSYDISGYNTIEPFDISEYEIDKPIDIFDNIEIKDKNVDMKKEITNYMELKDQYNLNDVIYVDGDDYRVIITDFYGCTSNDLVSYFSVSGYLLEK